jgi:hypothetical protein
MGKTACNTISFPKPPPPLSPPGEKKVLKCKKEVVDALSRIL